MLLFLLAFLAGILTIVSPCILPVLPFVFARADKPFMRSGLPMLAGMALTFAVIGSLASVAGNWVVTFNEYGRFAAMALLALFGLTLLFPALADRLTQPLVALGGRLVQSADGNGDGSAVWPSFVLGIATGLLWAPCAGPVLGLILTGAAINGANVESTLLLVAYAAGAAASLALALLVGGRAYAAMKQSLGAGQWIRRGLGALVLASVAAISAGLDTGYLTSLSVGSTTSIEQSLLEKLHPSHTANSSPSNAMRGGAAMSGGPAMSGGAAMTGPAMTGPAMSGGAMMSGGPAMSGGAMTGGAMSGGAMSGGGMMMGGNNAMMGGGMMMSGKSDTAPKSVLDNPMPPLDGAVEWLNSPPLTAAGLKGKVVLIDFWTYSCINCIRAVPYVRAWAEKYKDQGLVVIGVHTPEFAFERNVNNVRKAIATHQVTYPVAIDNNYAVWRAFNNNFWPAHYFIDAQGRVRHQHFGEGDYDKSERMIQKLLAEAGQTGVKPELVAVKATGAEAASVDMAAVKSHETYVGYDRAENFVSPGGIVKNERRSYTSVKPALNQWALSGDWTIGEEQASLDGNDGSIVYRFHARDLHLVLGPGTEGKPVRFTVTIDGKPPGASRGSDIDADGNGTVTEQRLYQLIRQGDLSDRTFEIRFHDPGVQAFAFTFG